MNYLAALVQRLLMRIKALEVDVCCFSSWIEFIYPFLTSPLVLDANRPGTY